MAVSVEQMRQTVATIATRLQNDAHFKKQLLNDPQAALAGAGLPSRIIYNMAEEKRDGHSGLRPLPTYECLNNTGCYCTCLPPPIGSLMV